MVRAAAAFGLVLAALASLSAPADAQPIGFPGLAATTPDVAADPDALSPAAPSGPSRLDESFRAAEQAVIRGDDDAAIALLRGILAGNPDLPRVKLELGLLYFRTGAFDLARPYLDEALANPNVPLDVKGRIKLCLAEIERRQAPFQYYLFLQAGARYQTNANIGPDSALVRAFGHDFRLADGFAKTPDWNLFQIAALDTSLKLTPRGDALEATLIGYNAEQQRLHQFDLGLVEAMIGPRLILTKDLSVKAYAIGDAVWLGNAPYFQALGGGGSVRANLGSRFVSEAYVEWRHRKFYDSSNFPTSSEQSGDLLTAAVLGELRLGRFGLLSRLGFETNDAAFDFNSYRRWSIDLGIPFEVNIPIDGIGHRVILTPTAGYAVTSYRMPDPLIDPVTTRLDRETRIGGIIDVQLYQAYGWRTQITQLWVHSSLPNYAMKNFSVAFGPTARF